MRASAARSRTNATTGPRPASPNSGRTAAGVDDHDLRRAQDDGLVQPGGVVVEEQERCVQPLVEGSSQLVIAGQAVDQRLTHDHRLPGVCPPPERIIGLP